MIAERKLVLFLVARNGIGSSDSVSYTHLNKQAGAQGVLIYTLRQALYLARLMCSETSGAESVKQLEGWIETAVRGALEYLWDKELQFFISGQDRQVSWASQIWLVLAGVLDQESNRRLLEHLVKEDPPLSLIHIYRFLLPYPLQ